MVYAYIRVSTDKQDCENQKFEILKFCQYNNIVIDEWIEETISGIKNPEKRKLGKILKSAKEGDLIICTEISRLGRSLYMIIDILHKCMDKGVTVQTIKDNFCLRDDISSKVLSFAFALAAEIERTLISQRTKEALARKRQEGVILGRPKGSRNKKVKLSGKESAIDVLLKEGCSYSEIARLLHCDRSTLTRFVKNHMDAQEKVS